MDIVAGLNPAQAEAVAAMRRAMKRRASVVSVRMGGGTCFFGWGFLLPSALSVVG